MPKGEAFAAHLQETPGQVHGNPQVQELPRKREVGGQVRDTGRFGEDGANGIQDRVSIQVTQNLRVH